MKTFFHTLGLTKKTTSYGFLPISLLLILSIITITPLFFNGKYMMALWIVYFFIIIKSFIPIDKKLLKLFIIGICFEVICTLYWFLGISSADLSYCLPGPFLYFAPILALIVIDRCQNQDQIRFLFHILSLVITINIIDSIWLTNSLNYTDLVYQNLKETEEGSKLNLGGNMYVTMTVFFASLMLFAFLKADNKTEKVLFLIYLFVSAYFIIFCSLKASAILLFLVSSVLQFLAKKGENNFRTSVFLSLLFFVPLFAYRDQVIYFLIDIIGSDRIASRLEVFLSSARVTDNASFAGREILWLTSLNSWLSNPTTFFFGIGDHNWQDFAMTADSGVGDHSDFFDVLARYGIMGGTLLYSSLIILYKYLHNRYATYYKLEILSFFILIILTGLTKKIVAAQTAIIIFVLLPLSLNYFSTQRNTVK